MTLTLELTPEEETVLQQQARVQGMDLNTLVRARLGTDCTPRGRLNGLTVFSVPPDPTQRHSSNK